MEASDTSFLDSVVGLESLSYKELSDLNKAKNIRAPSDIASNYQCFDDSSPTRRHALRGAAASNPHLDALGILQVKTPVNGRAFLDLVSHYPNQPLLLSVVRMLLSGSSSNLWSFNPPKVLHENHGSAREFEVENVSAEMGEGRRAEISMGQLAMLPPYSSNPLGVLDQGRDKKMLINDKSFPRGGSPNDAIRSDDFLHGHKL